MGGGGRGWITAPEHAGIGEWVVVGQEGDVVGETVMRKPKVENQAVTEETNGAYKVTNGH
jgi:hypothetical protein